MTETVQLKEYVDAKVVGLEAWLNRMQENQDAIFDRIGTLEQKRAVSNGVMASKSANQNKRQWIIQILLFSAYLAVTLILVHFHDVFFKVIK